MRALLLEGVGGLNSSDIYNFYFLWTLYANSPHIFKDGYAEHILKEYAEKFKAKYLKLFKQLIAEQLQKYAIRMRTDPDFDVKKISPDAPAYVLFELMKKTFRSDMQRRNDVWNLMAEHTAALEDAKMPKSIFISIDRLNASVHNTNTSVLGKFEGGHSLMTAYRATSTNDPNYWKQYVDKDIRRLADLQGPASHNPPGNLSEGDTVMITKSDRENTLFMMGLKQGVKDKGNDAKPDLDGKPEDFIRGYKLVKRTSWWDKTNDKLTRWASEFGKSYGNRH